jgi:uncharacterized protein involved in exopolysaccharide biosynthesis
MNTIKEELEYWRERKERVEREWGIIDLKQQRAETIKNLEGYRRELEEVSADLREKEALIRSLDELGSTDLDDVSSVLTGLLGIYQGRSAFEEMRGQLSELRVKESELIVTYTSEHQKVREIRERIAGLERYVEKEIHAHLFVSDTRVRILKSRVKYLSGMIARIEEETKTYPRKEVELERINTTLKHLQDSYDELVEQHMASKITVASNPEWTVTILNPATPGMQQKTRDYVRIALGPLFSIIVALGFAFFLDNLDHSIKNVSEAEEVLNLHVLASFPDRD